MKRCLQPPQEKTLSNFIFFLHTYFWLRLSKLWCLPWWDIIFLSCFQHLTPVIPMPVLWLQKQSEKGICCFVGNAKFPVTSILEVSDYCCVEGCSSIPEMLVSFWYVFCRVTVRILSISHSSSLTAHGLLTSFCWRASRAPLPSRASLPQVGPLPLPALLVLRNLESPILPQGICWGRGLWCARGDSSKQCQKWHLFRVLFCSQCSCLWVVWLLPSRLVPAWLTGSGMQPAWTPETRKWLRKSNLQTKNLQEPWEASPHWQWHITGEEPTKGKAWRSHPRPAKISCAHQLKYGIARVSMRMPINSSE